MAEKRGNSFSRPQSRNIKSSENPASKPEKIRRTAQPGNAPFPRAVAYHTTLSMAAKLVALWLYDHLKPGTNIATGSQELIAEELVICEKTVRSAIDELWKKHIIINVEKHPKQGGSYYLSYDMRIFPLDEPRTKLRPRFKTNAKSTKSTKSSTSLPNQPNQECPFCYGTGWHILENKQGAKPCVCKI